jgi:hypothetical protein
MRTALSSLLDSVASRIAGRELRLRLAGSAAQALRGRAGALELEFADVGIGELRIERMRVRISEPELSPGLPMRIRSGPIDVVAVVGQSDVERWIRRTGLPLRLELAPHGLVTSTTLADWVGLGGLRGGEFVTELEASGSWLRLRPQRAGWVELPSLVRDVMSGYLPLPPLPPDLRLSGVAHGRGRVEAHFEAPGLDDALVPGWTGRVLARLTGSASGDPAPRSRAG